MIILRKKKRNTQLRAFPSLFVVHGLTLIPGFSKCRKNNYKAFILFKHHSC